MLKNKNSQIAIGAILIIVIIITGYILFAGKTKTAKTVEQPVAQDIVQDLTAKDLGLKLSVSPDKKKFKFTIAEANDIKSISYEITYDADSTAEDQSQGADEKVSRGITGDAKIDGGKASYESQWLDLGSCSKKVCRYDTGVSKIDLTLKITKNNGKIYQAQDSLSI